MAPARPISRLPSNGVSLAHQHLAGSDTAAKPDDDQRPTVTVTLAAVFDARPALIE